MRVRATFFIHERIRADDQAGMRLGDGAKLGADIAFTKVGTELGALLPQGAWP
jgi:hypothetical protein